jgi:hypothetical protein
VYLAKFYDSVRDEERFVQKYNGRLVIGKWFINFKQRSIPFFFKGRYRISMQI